LARKTGDSSEALIVSSAAKIGAIRILSEDLNAGQRIAGILIGDPFVGIH
jgi:predicted nucleic acid-binding protein